MKLGDLFFEATVADAKLVASAKRAGDKAGAAAQSTFQRRMNAFKQGIAQGVGIGAFNLLGSAIQRVTSFLGDSAKAYREEQVSVQKLTTSLRANTSGQESQIDAIEGVLAARMKLGFSDDEQRQSLGELVAAYGDVNKALEVQRIAMDLARFSGVDLATASDTLIKVHAGQYRALKALGIQTKDIKTEQQALNAIMKVASGQAEDYAETIEGKLTVAEIKAGESSEKFGKSIARLQADIIPAAADAVAGLADQIDGIQTAFDDSATPAQQFDSLMTGIAANPLWGSGFLAMFGDDLADVRAEMDGPFDHAAFKAAERTDALAQALDDAGPPAKEFTGELSDGAKAAADLEREVDDLASTISDELFGDAINAGNLADLRNTHDELVKQRDEVKKGSREWKILTGEIAENEQAQFDLQLQMKEKEGAKAVIDWLKKQITKFGDANGAIGELIRKYQRLEDAALSAFEAQGGVVVQGGRKQKRGGRPRTGHSGTSVDAGTPYLIHPREEVFVPERNGFVAPVPRAALGGMPTGTTGHGGISVTIEHLDASGHSSPQAVASAVRGVMDKVAIGLRDESLLFVGRPRR